MEMKGRDGRDTAPLGAIHRSFVSFISLCGDSSPLGRIRGRIVIPSKINIINLKVKPKI